MQKLYIEQTRITPEINFDPDQNIFLIRGTSAPEDVRSLYYPVIEWIRIFVDDLFDGEYRKFNRENPLKIQIDLDYFNSSSAKFLFDIFAEFKRLPADTIPVITEWHHDEEDLDMKEAGQDISYLVECDFVYVPKQRSN